MGVLGFFLVESAPDIMALGQVIQTEVSELGMQIPELPQTLNRHNQTKLPRIINNRVQREIGILQFPVKDIIEIFQKNVKSYFIQKFHILFHKAQDEMSLGVLFNFLNFWLHWVFHVAACGLSLVAVSGDYFSLRCLGFSLRWLLLLRSTGSRHVGFSSCGSRALERRLSSCGARA